MPGIIEAPRSISLAADVEPEQFAPLVSQLQGVEGVDSAKIGFEVALGLTLETASGIAHDAGLKSVYDHQKAGNDIHLTSKNFVRAMLRGKVDAAILFPFTGPVVQEYWTKALLDGGVRVISGGEMTHPQIAASADGLSEGYVHPKAFKRMYALAVDLGVRDFVVPGNKPEKVTEYKSLLDELAGENEFSLWAPGFIDQGGDISETGAVAGPNFNAIVGGGIYNAENPRLTAQLLGQKILGKAA